MRIVGGRLKGRALKSPGSDAIRPTSDRLRETVFNILAHSYGNPVAGARVIDLFSGTGAMAIEALSRGTHFALVVDQSANACAIIRANFAALDLGGAARILRRDARNVGPAPEERVSVLPFSIRPTERISSRQRSKPCATEAGSAGARWRSSRNARGRRSPCPTDLLCARRAASGRRRSCSRVAIKSTGASSATRGFFATNAGIEMFRASKRC